MCRGCILLRRTLPLLRALEYPFPGLHRQRMRRWLEVTQWQYNLSRSSFVESPLYEFEWCILGKHRDSVKSGTEDEPVALSRSSYIFVPRRSVCNQSSI
jgi:hypothetical protein